MVLQACLWLLFAYFIEPLEGKKWIIAEKQQVTGLDTQGATVFRDATDANASDTSVGEDTATSNQYCSGSFCLSWVIWSPYITFTMSQSATGYVAVGFSDSPGSMGPADAYAGWVDRSGVAYGYDFTTNGQHDVNDPDAQQDALNISGTLVDGLLNITFTRLLDTQDSNDKVISNSTMNVIWCWSDALPTFTSTTRRSVSSVDLPDHPASSVGSASINFFSTDQPDAGDDSEGDPMLWIPVVDLAGFIVLLTLVGLAFRFCNNGFMRRIKIFLRRHPLKPLKSNIWHTMTLDFVREFCDLSIGEFLLVSIWLVGFFLLLLTPDPGDGLGRLCSFGLGTILLPVTKNSIWLATLGCPFDRAIKFHRWVARVTLVVLTAHLIVQALDQGIDIFTANTDDLGCGWVFGFSSYCIIIFISLLSVEPIRRHLYELFYYPHFLGFAAIALAMVHSYAVCYVMIPGLALYLLDKAVILYRMCQKFRIRSVTSLGEVALVTVETNKVFKQKPGQYCWLWVPAASKIQKHPFTIARNNTEDNSLSFLIKGMGPSTFTQRVHDLAGVATALNVRLNGPYGSLGSRQLEDYSVIYLIAGGVGVTPMLNIAESLLHTKPAEMQVHFIWSCRNSSAFHQWCPDLLQQMASTPGFNIHLYSTSGDDMNQIYYIDTTEPIPVSAPTPDEVIYYPKDAFTEPMPFSAPTPNEVIYYPKDETKETLDSFIITGRPNFGKLLAESNSTGSDVFVLVCGPEPMQVDAQRVAQKYHYEFHKETFMF